MSKELIKLLHRFDNEDEENERGKCKKNKDEILNVHHSKKLHYEGGAHFSYTDLYCRLITLATKLPPSRFREARGGNLDENFIPSRVDQQFLLSKQLCNNNNNPYFLQKKEVTPTRAFQKASHKYSNMVNEDNQTLSINSENKKKDLDKLSILKSSVVKYSKEAKKFIKSQHKGFYLNDHNSGIINLGQHGLSLMMNREKEGDKMVGERNLVQANSVKSIKMNNSKIKFRKEDSRPLSNIHAHTYNFQSQSHRNIFSIPKLCLTNEMINTTSVKVPNVINQEKKQHSLGIGNIPSLISNYPNKRDKRVRFNSLDVDYLKSNDNHHMLIVPTIKTRNISNIKSNTMLFSLNNNQAENISNYQTRLEGIKIQ